MKWRIDPPLTNPCSECDGSGGEWKRRADGRPDRRYSSAIGPCPRCNGTRVDPSAQTGEPKAAA